MPRKPASPSFFHMWRGNSLLRSVDAATSSGISRRVKSCTRSRSSWRSSVVGGVKFFGCFEDVEAGRTKGDGNGRNFVVVPSLIDAESRRGMRGDAMVVKTISGACISVLKERKKMGDEKAREKIWGVLSSPHH